MLEKGMGCFLKILGCETKPAKETGFVVAVRMVGIQEVA